MVPMARAVEQHKAKPAKRKSRRRTTSRQRGGSPRNPSKAESSPWLSLEDVFQRWCVRLESSHEAVDEVYALLCNRETRSRKWRVDTSGEEIPNTLSFLNAQFWQERPCLLVVPDADGVGDHLGIDYMDYVDVYSLPNERMAFSVRRRDVELWEWLHPELAAPEPAPSKEPTPKKKRRRKAKQPSRAGAPEEHDWEEGELFVMQELETRGNPLDKNNQTEGWKTISDVAKLLRKHLKDVSRDEDYEGPDVSTCRGRASDWIKKFERERNKPA
jgi:hypothetical protein